MTFLTRTRFKTALLGSVAILCTSLPTQLRAQQATDETNKEIVVDPLVINAEQPETPTSPVQGYVAKRSATGSKTDTPLSEIPQSVSVIGREEMDNREPSG